MSGAAELSAYALSLGITAEPGEHDTPLLALPFDPIVEGRPTVLHGGATSGLLESAGYAALRDELGRQGRPWRLTRLGRRNANVEVTAWQDDPACPVATAVMNILMVDPTE